MVGRIFLVFLMSFICIKFAYTHLFLDTKAGTNSEETSIQLSSKKKTRIELS